MSKTDKTQPYWVKTQDPQQRVEIHNHSRGVCDLDDYDPKHNHYISYWWHHCYYRLKREDIVYPRVRSVKHYRTCWIRFERNTVRMKIRDMMKSTREDIYDNEFGNYQHRHWALWEAW